jgi:glycolate oxidase
MRVEPNPLNSLEAELGLGARFLTEPAQLAAFASDALTSFSQRPLAVAVPESTAEVTAIVQACERHRVPFVARGSGTSLSGGSLPVADGIVIALNRLNRVVELDAERRVAVVEPGVVNLELSRLAEPHGLYYAPDPSSQSVCTIGGNLAFNSGGAHCLKHGMTSNHILGMRVVLPDGELVEMGGSSTESAGPDWTGMFCGSEGLFGIALEITVRLLPLPEATHTTLAVFPGLEQAGLAVAEVIADGLLPEAMEIMDTLAIEAAEASVKPDYPTGGVLLIVELAGEAVEVEADALKVEASLLASGATELKATSDAAARALIWRGRKSAFSAVGWLAPDYVVQDGVVPRTRLGDALAGIERMSAAAGMRVANVFHAGDGNLHPLILFDGREPGALERAGQLADEILALCVDLGGSITGEHGVGIEKREHLELMFGPEDMGFMRRLKASVDPADLSNPGKMLGDAA